MVAGLLRMQEASAGAPEVATALREAVSRILAITNLHGQLQTLSSGEADVLSVLRAIADGTCGILGSQGVSLSVEGDSMICPRGESTSLAVAACELITNAIKHRAPVEGASYASRCASARLGRSSTSASGTPATQCPPTSTRSVTRTWD